MNKYLWYIDFENFRVNVMSITVLRYMRYSHGFIIEDFKYIEMLRFVDDKIKVEEFEDGFRTITIIKSKKNYNLMIFREEELKVINNVIDKLKDKTAAKSQNYPTINKLGL